MPFTNVRYGKRLAREASFETIMQKNKLMYNLEKANTNSDEILGFVIDPSTDSAHNNMVIIGKLTDFSGVGENNSKNKMSFKIEQNIRK